MVTFFILSLIAVFLCFVYCEYSNKKQEKEMIQRSQEASAARQKEQAARDAIWLAKWMAYEKQDFETVVKLDNQGM